MQIFYNTFTTSSLIILMIGIFVGIFVTLYFSLNYFIKEMKNTLQEYKNFQDSTISIQTKIINGDIGWFGLRKIVIDKSKSDPSVLEQYHLEEPNLVIIINDLMDYACSVGVDVGNDKSITRSEALEFIKDRLVAPYPFDTYLHHIAIEQYDRRFKKN